MGSVTSGSPIQLQVHLWLRPHLAEYAASLATGPLHTIDYTTRDQYLSRLVLDVLTKRHQPQLPPHFTAGRQRLTCLIGLRTGKERGAWVSEQGMRQVEKMLKYNFYTNLHAYVRAHIKHGVQAVAAIDAWMDEHNISPEHMDYHQLHVRLCSGVAGLPPLRKYDTTPLPNLRKP